MRDIKGWQYSFSSKLCKIIQGTRGRSRTGSLRRKNRLMKGAPEEVHNKFIKEVLILEEKLTAESELMRS